MNDFLRATHRGQIAQVADNLTQQLLSSDEDARYDELIDINLDTLEPHINGPFTPDWQHPSHSSNKQQSNKIGQRI